MTINLWKISKTSPAICKIVTPILMLTLISSIFFAFYLHGLTEQDAIDISPTGDICTTGEIEEIFVPDNRGRGNNNGHWITVDNRVFEPAFLRMDVNYDGLLNREDAMIAVKNIYVRQIENEICPAVADIGTFPQGFGPDGFLTSEDINQWHDARKNGVQEKHFQLLDSDKLICASECTIINHMKPGNKK